ncbi:hypothetical protein Ddye_026286 [Dipteronia dyeriana]|uniref:Uncharacterized protein n=1 Tax=Dipteronia dyeriana TaxID=168575 RepID=A0AAD9WPF0_9ROSI|nr:hypothetical protein Ddye_026286 [Dipteronia dyeriana]
MEPIDIDVDVDNKVEWSTRNDVIFICIFQKVIHSFTVKVKFNRLRKTQHEFSDLIAHTGYIKKVPTVKPYRKKWLKHYENLGDIFHNTTVIGQLSFSSNQVPLPSNKDLEVKNNFINSEVYVNVDVEVEDDDDDDNDDGDELTEVSNKKEGKMTHRSICSSRNRLMRVVAKRFQRSKDTMYRQFKRILKGLCGLAPNIIREQTQRQQPPPLEIRDNPKFCPYFKMQLEDKRTVFPILMKARFTVLENMPNYRSRRQRFVPIACYVLHNFIRSQCRGDRMLREYKNEDMLIDGEGEGEGGKIPNIDLSPSNIVLMRNVRDEIIKKNRKIAHNSAFSETTSFQYMVLDAFSEFKTETKNNIFNFIFIFKK